MRGTATVGAGVRGDATSGDAVSGQSDSGTGVHSKTTNGLYGIVGESGSANSSAGLLGVANGPNAVGFGTIAQGGATFADNFNGTTAVAGTFAVTGSKSAAVKDSAGDYRLMYCMEAADAWCEDMGKAKLTNGAATVQIDPAFAQHIHTDDYHVFLTEYGGSSRLYVETQNAGGFVVRAKKGTGSGTFSWRVVGKRADTQTERLAKFAMPLGLKLPDTSPLHPSMWRHRNPPRHPAPQQ